MKTTTLNISSLANPHAQGVCFCDFDDIDAGGSRLLKPKIHLRIQKRNARKHITVAEGIYELDGINIKRLLRELRKKFCCMGSEVRDAKTDAKFLQLSGDQRENLKTFLLAEGLVEKSQIVVHGF